MKTTGKLMVYCRFLYGLIPVFGLFTRIIKKHTGGFRFCVAPHVVGVLYQYSFIQDITVKADVNLGNLSTSLHLR